MRIKAITVRAYISLASEISLVDAFARAQSGEKEGFEQLYLHYQPIYENQLRRLVDEREVVEELGCHPECCGTVTLPKMGALR